VLFDSSGATTVVRFEFDSLCMKAESIVYVRCVQTKSFRDNDRIVTQSRFEVIEHVKGIKDTEVVLTLPGGQVEEGRLHIPGIPRFKPGETLVLFLSKPDVFGSPWPMGLGQGCYRALEETHEDASILLHSGLTPLPSGVVSKAAAQESFKIPLRQFLSQVRSTLESPTDRR